MPRFSAALPTSHTTGDHEEMALTMGEAAGRIHSVECAGDIVRRMALEAKVSWQRLDAVETKRERP